jgi:hypothetical protein
MMDILIQEKEVPDGFRIKTLKIDPIQLEVGPSVLVLLEALK